MIGSGETMNVAIVGRALCPSHSLFSYSVTHRSGELLIEFAHRGLDRQPPIVDGHCCVGVPRLRERRQRRTDGARIEPVGFMHDSSFRSPIHSSGVALANPEDPRGPRVHSIGRRPNSLWRPAPSLVTPLALIAGSRSKLGFPTARMNRWPCPAEVPGIDASRMKFATMNCLRDASAVRLRAWPRGPG